MSDNELYGKDAELARAGFEKMPPSSPPESNAAPANDLDLDTAVTERTATAIPESVIVPREYVSLNDNVPADKKYSVDVERAIEDLGARRAQEFQLAAQLRDQQLKDQLEALRSPVADKVGQAQAGKPMLTPEEISHLPIEQQVRMLQEAQDLQDLANTRQEASQHRAEPPAQAQPVDQDLSRVLSENPKLLEAIERQRQADWAGAQQTVQAAEQWIQASAAQAAAGVLVNFPELQNLSPQELPVALNLMARQNPERHAQAMKYINAVQGIINQANQVQQQQQQRAAQQYQHEWSKWSEQEDEKFSARHPEAARDPQLAQKAYSYLEEGLGLSKSEIARLYNGDATISFRDSRVQSVLFDAVRWRQAQAKLPQARKNAPAKVMHPGPAGTVASAEDVSMRGLANSLSNATGNAAARLGAEIIAQRRLRGRY